MPKNISPSKHADYNGFRPLLDTADATTVRFWDVGTGNCNTLINAAGQQFLFYDFGGNGTGNSSKTYPSPHPAFDFTANPTFIISHWDDDHVYSIKKFAAAGACQWIGPREDIAPKTLKVINSKCTNLRAYVSGGPAHYTFTTSTGIELKMVRCTGNPHGLNAADRKERNDTGIALFLYFHTPAWVAVDAMKRHATAHPGQKNATAAAAGGLGTDIYKNCVILAASDPLHADETAVVAAAQAALVQNPHPVKLMAQAVIAALDAAKATPLNAAAAAAAVQGITGNNPAHRYLHGVWDAAQKAATNQPGNAAAVATDAKAALTPGLVTNPAAVAAVAMYEHALANVADLDGTLAAAGAPGDNPYAMRVLAAAKEERKKLTATARSVALAGVDALSPPTTVRSAVLLTGDACYQSIPNALAHAWDVLEAYHHGSYLNFTQGTNSSTPPRPVLEGHSRIVYSSGKRGAMKVHGHPHADAINKYRQFGWAQARELYTASMPGAPRGNRDYAIP
ncbi:hypothetical protein HPC49_16895 [Pyxidicoccus fallax]|uniref:Uncharacterized protein n=1 Tax=Pyxidicoccus fallax TaxID=394095 RepID=A0A848LNG4_9BACT|nr:hypothetical protein [Pyxidicoccus fallax]NMO19210.1 hypothetical protein [Pyxidicoccus fallax]NPC79893.1 hypothetical protein [Pyxidicoccus fallax]